MVATKPKKPAPTALDAFIRDPKKKKPVYDMPSFVPMESSRTPVPANGSAGRQAKPNKKPKPQPELPAKRRFTGDKSFDPDVRQVKLDDLVRVFGESRIHFADTQSIWLKDMAAYLNHLLPYELSEPAFRKNNDPNYPSSLLKAEIRSFLREMLEDCANPTLQLFQSHCVETVIRNMGLQRPVAGYMVMLQVLGHEFPDVTVANMRTFVESVNVNRPRPAVAVPLCWLALQSMQSSPSHAAAMWTQLLSPLTGSSNAAHVRAYNDFAIHSLEVMLLKLSTDRDSRISPSSFTAIFDFLSHQKSSSNAGRAVPLFPMLVAASLRTDTEFSVLCEIFNHFLRRLSDASASKEEVRDVLLHCLLTGEEMFHHWVTVEHKFTNGSSLLLGHLSESGLLHKFPHRIVLETITQLKARAEANDNLISAQRSLQAIGVSTPRFADYFSCMCDLRSLISLFR